MTDQTAFQVWFNAHAQTSKSRNHELVEVDYNNLERFLAALNDKTLIPGSRLITHWSADEDVRLVVDRVPLVFRGDSVARVELSPWTLREFTG